MTEDQKVSLKRLLDPFEAHQINKLPKPYSKDAAKGNCKECGGYHGLPAAHLDYVGHAALTARLLEVDPLWTWEPCGVDSMGLPAIDKDGGLWIKLTVCGVTRLGYGDAQGKTGGNATKERIGDALRNAGMRFGAALELWHKGILYMDQDELPVEQKVQEKHSIQGPNFDKALQAIRSGKYNADEMRGYYALTPDQDVALADLLKELKK